MKKKIILSGMAAALLFTGCSGKTEANIIPLMNLEWFSEVSDVKSNMSNYSLTQERESNDGDNHQNLLDYSGTELFETACDLTLCFIEQGLVGFNYHDIEKNNSYREWFDKIETLYGVPTEKGSGMASWYDDPVGKNTALYLFNLEEGVQISFYATTNTPDKSYSKQDNDRKESYVPTPELRTPIVPVIEDTVTTTKGTSVSVHTEVRTSVVTDDAGEVVEIVTEYYEPDNIRVNQEEISVASSTTSTDTSAAATTAVTTTYKKENDFKQNLLQFYATPEFERKRMSVYNQVYEYKTEEAGQPWELIMQYENVPYCDKNCDMVLCFTSLGLIGINYFDNDIRAYDEWVDNITKLHGSPTESHDDYTMWEDNTLDDDTVIYIFALDDGVQISFFVDDTGSELS